MKQRSQLTQHCPVPKLSHLPVGLGPCRAQPRCMGLLPELSRDQMRVPAAPR